MIPAFTRPWALAPAAALALVALALGLAAQLRPGLGVRVVRQRPWLLAAGLALGLLGVGLGVAEPRWGLPEQPRLTVHVVVDASRSMKAADAGGQTRWAAAVKRLDQLWAAPQPGVRCALDLLTGDVIPLLPPGEDRPLLRDALRAVAPGELGSPGTSLGRDLGQVAAQVAPDEPAIILLLSDGEETWESAGDAEARAVAALKAAKLPLYAVALGGPEGVPVPGADGTEPPVTKANPDLLRRIAEGSGGKLLGPSEDLHTVLDQLASGHRPLPVGRSKQPAHPEWGAWLALGGLMLWMLGSGKPLSAWRVDL